MKCNSIFCKAINIHTRATRNAANHVCLWLRIYILELTMHLAGGGGISALKFGSDMWNHSMQVKPRNKLFNPSTLAFKKAFNIK